MRVSVAWFGRRSASPYEDQIETYRLRIDRRWKAEDRVLRPIAGGREKDPRRTLRLEAEALLRHHEPGWRLVALDERGERRDSVAFTGWLGDLEDRSVGGILFVIGSDLGLDPGLVGGANERLSLSSMTLPHLLARLVLWEQLYRATDILSGGAYHRK
jgi:23S rRNA (pseudouridine1915-N3)-methyltransferase